MEALYVTFELTMRFLTINLLQMISWIGLIIALYIHYYFSLVGTKEKAPSGTKESFHVITVTEPTPFDMMTVTLTQEHWRITFDYLEIISVRVSTAVGARCMRVQKLKPVIEANRAITPERSSEKTVTALSTSTTMM